MSKRIAQSDLNSDNWDQPEEIVEKGDFNKADDSKISARTILSARRSSLKSGTGGSLRSFTGFTSLPPTFQSNGLFNFSKSEKDQPSKAEPATDPSSANEQDRRLSLIKSLNEGVLAWITKHVKDDPYCVLSPVFADYDKHLSTIEKRVPENDGPNRKENEHDTKKQDTSPSLAPSSSSAFTFKFAGDKTSGLTANKRSTTDSDSLESHSKPFEAISSSHQPFEFPPLGSALTSFTTPISSDKHNFKKTPTFQFGFANKLAAGSQPVQSAVTFSLDAKSKTLSTPASFLTQSFPPQLGANKEKADEADAEDNEEYIPPVPEAREIKEEGSVFTTRCKLFYKLSDSWKERGLGNLYIKPDGDSKDKFQLLIRADTNLGTILLNIIVTKDMPIKQQKNNLTLVCVPNPPVPGANCEKKELDSSLNDKSNLVPMLIRVKTEDAASNLLEELNKYRSCS
ncbi:unnamed protein product [Protopolystoma xenopodis]|uniref:RanBD1 domain-containing protein n=1 Tax=Protopolystoma xenopodis TaxID=117903 RepID=A0A448XNG1_9PLAT|nr:unnamed protein product [Protopolystoma xenopodis]